MRFFAIAIACAAPCAGHADPLLGERLFAAEAVPPCGICHTLAAAGTAGAIGPVLDDLKPDAARVRVAVSQGVGIMPSYGEALSPEEIAAVAEYVARASGGQ
ncbi:MAG: cytochrome c [Pseudomonadota bacterium]